MIMSVRGQYDLVNTTGSILSVCDKPYHTKKDSAEGRGDGSFTKLCIYGQVYFYQKYLPTRIEIMYIVICVQLQVDRYM